MKLRRFLSRPRLMKVIKDSFDINILKSACLKLKICFEKNSQFIFCNLTCFRISFVKWLKNRVFWTETILTSIWTVNISSWNQFIKPKESPIFVLTEARCYSKSLTMCGCGTTFQINARQVDQDPTYSVGIFRLISKNPNF